MIIRLYKAGFGFQLIFFSLVAVLLWTDAFISPQLPAIPAFTTPLYQVVVMLFSKLPAIVNVIAALALLLIQSYILNYALSENKIIPSNTFLAVLIYCMLMSYDPSLLRIHPVLLANLFIILAMRIILRIYNEKEPYADIFNAGFLISMASIFYLPSILFLIFIWVAFFIYRVSTTREWVIIWIGILAPYLYIAIYYFVFDKLNLFYDKYVSFFIHPEPIHLKSNGFDYAFGAVMSILTMVSVFRMLSDSGGKVINIRKRILVIIYMLIVSLLTVFYAGDTIIFHICMAFIALSAIVTYYFTALKKMLWAELFFTSVLLIIILEKIFT